MLIFFELKKKLFYSGKYKWKRPFGKPIELYRCESDRILLGDEMMSIGVCAGHRFRQPVTPTMFELILVWFRLIR
jgi:hypothetical protein